MIYDIEHHGIAGQTRCQDTADKFTMHRSPVLASNTSELKQALLRLEVRWPLPAYTIRTMPGSAFARSRSPAPTEAAPNGLLQQACSPNQWIRHSRQACRVDRRSMRISRLASVGLHSRRNEWRLSARYRRMPSFVRPRTLLSSAMAALTLSASPSRRPSASSRDASRRKAA